MTDDLKTFREQGYLCIKGAVARDVVRPVKDYISSELKRLEIWSGGRNLSKRLDGVPVFQQIGKLGQWIRYPRLKEKLISKSLYSVMSQFAGATLTSDQDAQLLISLPQRADWTLEGLNWHRDISPSQLAHLPGVQAFVLLDDLAAQGGATLALAGSHKLRDPAQTKQGITKILAGGVNKSVSVDGIELSVLEMSGRAGDVYLMDMRLIHTPSINATKTVRMMATIRYFAT